jgi:hypothetical protein
MILLTGRTPSPLYTGHVMPNGPIRTEASFNDYRPIALTYPRFPPTSQEFLREPPPLLGDQLPSSIAKLDKMPPPTIARVSEGWSRSAEATRAS